MEQKFSNIYAHPGRPDGSKDGEPDFISSLFLCTQTAFASPEQVTKMSKAKYTVSMIGRTKSPKQAEVLVSDFNPMPLTI